MSKKKVMSEKMQAICNCQIDISLKAEINMVNVIPLKKLVGFASYDGNGYSKDFEPHMLTKEQLNKVNPARSYGKIEKR